MHVALFCVKSDVLAKCNRVVGPSLEIAFYFKLPDMSLETLRGAKLAYLNMPRCELSISTSVWRSRIHTLYRGRGGVRVIGGAGGSGKGAETGERYVGIRISSTRFSARLRGVVVRGWWMCLYQTGGFCGR
jgi:hypothetical protein